MRKVREIREQMARHISEDTLCNYADQLISDGRALFNQLEALRDESAERREVLEAKHLNENCAAAEVQEELSSVEAQCAEFDAEIAQWGVESRPRADVPIKAPKPLGAWSRRKAPFGRQLQPV